MEIKTRNMKNISVFICLIASLLQGCNSSYPEEGTECIMEKENNAISFGNNTWMKDDVTCCSCIDNKVSCEDVSTVECPEPPEDTNECYHFVTICNCQYWWLCTEDERVKSEIELGSNANDIHFPMAELSRQIRAASDNRNSKDYDDDDNGKRHQGRDRDGEDHGGEGRTISRTSNRRSGWGGRRNMGHNRGGRGHTDAHRARKSSRKAGGRSPTTKRTRKGNSPRGILPRQGNGPRKDKSKKGRREKKKNEDKARKKKDKKKKKKDKAKKNKKKGKKDKENLTGDEDSAYVYYEDLDYDSYDDCYWDDYIWDDYDWDDYNYYYHYDWDDYGKHDDPKEFDDDFYALYQMWLEAGKPDDFFDFYLADQYFKCHYYCYHYQTIINNGNATVTPVTNSTVESQTIISATNASTATSTEFSK